MKLARLLLALLVMLASSATSAKAHDGLGGLGLATLYGYGGFNNFQRSFNSTPPYFSLHPPVYYGKRYTRPYGASPFAAWPQLQSAAGYAPAPHVTRSLHRPAIIVNPYVPMEAVPAPVMHQDGVVEYQAVQPQVIENPYFQPTIQYTTKTN